MNNRILAEIGITLWQKNRQYGHLVAENQESIQDSSSIAQSTKPETNPEINQLAEEAPKPLAIAAAADTTANSLDIASSAAVSANQTHEATESDTVEVIPQDTPDHSAEVLDWSQLSKRFLNTNECDSCSQDSALSMGPHEAKFAVVIDAPITTNSDYSRYFSPRKLKLMSAILRALDLDMQDVYFTSIFKCLPGEAQRGLDGRCADFVRNELSLLDSKYVLVFGEFSAQKLLRANESIEQLRRASIGAEQFGARLILAPQLSDLLDQPELKAQLWNDLKSVRF